MKKYECAKRKSFSWWRELEKKVSIKVQTELAFLSIVNMRYFKLCIKVAQRNVTE